ncbi:MAG: PAS domain-containing protein [Trichlorobacter sp.]|uniref:PAS domain-containing sensor histidine kinase n=1 Tax=Trichlorobacter sp. TaxID=2911007 RepID=UPI0025668B2E|nr:PAS domain-containing protein [Trichlorobacter sp.]MDK9719320.1 PAS domain-containing protein [Trichlorobacter sp.]
MAPHRKMVCSLLDDSGETIGRAEIIQQFPALIWHSGQDARCDYFNQTWLLFTGRTLEQELGDGWMEGIHPEDLAGCLKTYLEAFEARQPFTMEYRLRYHDGSYRWIIDHGSPHYAIDGCFCGYIGSCYDSTRQKEEECALRTNQTALEQQVEQCNSALQRSYDLLNNISRQVPGGIYQFQLFSDGHYSIPYASQSILDLFELQPEELQSDASPVFNKIVAEDLAGLMASIQESAETLNPWHHEFRAAIPSRGVRWFQGNSRPQRQPDNSVIWCGFVTDISERKELERQLVEAQRLEYIGQLAAGVAHEVRNPLNAILTVTEALFREEGVEGNQTLTPYIEHIRSQVDRLARLMNDLLSLGRRQQEDQLVPLALAEFCRQTVELWQRSNQTGSLAIDLEIPSTLENVMVRADIDRLQQVLFNLLDNAGQHSQSASAIRLVLETAQPDLVGGQILLRVVDRGSGVVPELLERVFEPFFTTRRGGTGLGLALVKQFIEQMGGMVQICNNYPEPGCTVTLQLPRASEECLS